MMNKNNELIEYQYNLIERYFKNTSEEFDDLDWDGETLKVWLDDDIIEEYTYDDLIEEIEDFETITKD